MQHKSVVLVKPWWTSLCFLLFTLWWSSSRASGRAFIFSHRLMDFLEVFQGHIFSLFYKTALALSSLHASECQQNQLAGYVERLHWQRHVNNLLTNSRLWSETRLFDGKIAADVGAYRGRAVFRLFCKHPADLLLVSASWFVQRLCVCIDGLAHTYSWLTVSMKLSTFSGSLL